jgi:hypothetical protein
MVKQRPQRPLASPSPATRRRGKGPTAAELGEQIGHELRAMFNDVVTEPVPEKFRVLLEELERKSSKT